MTDFRIEIQGAGEDWYYYPSLAVNAQNDMCLGFARSSPNLYVEGVVAGRTEIIKDGRMVSFCFRSAA